MLTLAGGSYFASLPTWPHSESTQFTPSFPTFFFFLSLSPRAQLARFRVSCLGESGVTTLVKEPEAELIIVIKASYLHNTSQAEGTQSMFPGPGRKSCPASTLLCASLEAWNRGWEGAHAHIILDHLRCRAEGSCFSSKHQPGLQRV